MTITWERAFDAAEIKRQREARLERQRAIAKERELRRRLHFSQSAPLRIRMVVSPWYFDEFGNRTRSVRAI